MESSPNKKTLRGHTKMISTFDSRPTRNSSHFQTAGTANNGINGMNKTFNTFMSPANKTMKDAFFNLPHMNSQQKHIRHLSIQRLGEDTF